MLQVINTAWCPGGMSTLWSCPFAMAGWSVLGLLPWDPEGGGCSAQVSVKSLHLFNFYFKRWESVLLPLQEE